MRISLRLVVTISLGIGGLLACVDPEAILLRGTVDIVVVDGTITDLNEPQTVRLNRSKADPFTGRFGTLPITKAVVEIVIDSAEVVACHETIDGTYQLPTGYRGRVGHAYQLRFTLPDGTRYASNQQIMSAVPPIDKITARFNPTSLPGNRYAGLRAAHDFYLDAQDPANQRNFYRWDWTLYERQVWCRSCTQGVYSINNVIVRYNGPYPLFYRGDKMLEACYQSPVPLSADGKPITLFWVYDYECRTRCWEIVSSYDLNLFDDVFTDGSSIVNRQVAQIPFFQSEPALVVIRQGSLTADAHRYFRLLRQQTQNAGGLADTPPVALVGNVQNQANDRENVIGYFTASAVAKTTYWLDRKDTEGSPPGLFLALNNRDPVREPSPPNVPIIRIIDTTAQSRPYTAVCVPSDNRTPFKPEGWRD